MADNLRKRGTPDSKTINMNEEWEKEYWKRKFQVTGQQLAGAVRAVGKSVKRVTKSTNFWISFRRQYIIRDMSAQLRRIGPQIRSCEFG